MKKYSAWVRSAIMQNLVVLIGADTHAAWHALYTDCLCDMLLR